ncbi:glycosyltransferase family 2 protein [Amaricoccus solimangrovi]|nr:glycosyltransferase family A protein [Amaricoccus solimangrovi]
MDTPCPVAVLIPTFRRPEGLALALESLAAQTVADFPIVVADNDAEAAAGIAVARAWKSERPGCEISWISVPARGLSQNRNAGLSHAFARYPVEAVAMLDDDSHAEPEWLERLAEAVRGGEADLLGGPTLYTFPPATPGEIRGLEMFGVPYASSGPVPRLRSANNLAVRRRFFEARGPELFHPDFARSGGEDTYLFRSALARGERMEWVAGARVVEPVPEHRCAEAWILSRHRTSAANSARISRMLDGELAAWRREVGSALKEVGGGLLRFATNRRPRIVMRQRFAGAAGRIAGLTGALPSCYG